MEKRRPKIWFITGASRGFGLEIAKVALENEDYVVATGRNLSKLYSVLGLDSEKLLCAEMDVTNSTSIKCAVTLALEKFGRISILVNNAGYGQMGAFEEVSESAVEKQFATNVFGLMAVTREVLPVMREKRGGHIFNIASVAGLKGGNRYGVYSASKFAVVGFSESLAQEVRGFGIKVTCIEPGYFRTDFLDSSSMKYGDKSIDDYAVITSKFKRNLSATNQLQNGDPYKLAQAMIVLASSENAPIHFPVGADAIEWVDDRNRSISEDIDAWKNLSVRTKF